MTIKLKAAGVTLAVLTCTYIVYIAVVNKTTTSGYTVVEKRVVNGVQYGIFPVVRKNESRSLQEIIYQSQNPHDCIHARKAVCKLHSNTIGLIAQVHAYSYCLQVALTTNRTLIIDTTELPHIYQHGFFQRDSESCNFYRELAVQDAVVEWQANWNREITGDLDVVVQITPTTTLFQPGHVPSQVMPFLSEDHVGDPTVWWAAHSVEYLMRTTETTKIKIQGQKAALAFTHPIVGIHIRRTDKVIREATFQSNQMYMTHVINWYDEHYPDAVVRRVYVATDDLSAVLDLRKAYPDYTFISDDKIVGNAQFYERKSKVGSLGIIMDVSLLSECDFVVCTYTSNIGRVLYEMFHLKYKDPQSHILSIDSDYQSDWSYSRIYQAVTQNAESTNELELAIGDRLSSVVLKAKPYFLYGTNERTNQEGFYPLIKVKPVDIAAPQNIFLSLDLKSVFRFVVPFLKNIYWIIVVLLCVLITIFLVSCVVAYTRGMCTKTLFQFKKY